MSTYSTQIETILQEKLVPRMNELSMDVARAEPYSYSNEKLEDDKRQLDYLSMIYDFLYEYTYWSEELNNGKLVNIVRLLDPPTREKKSLDVLSRSKNRSVRIITGYKMFIDKLEVTNDTIIAPGSKITITLTYSTTAKIYGSKSISLDVDGLTQTNDGFTITLQNKEIPLSLGGTTLVFTAQAIEDNTPIGSPQIYNVPVDIVIDNTFYYGVEAPGFTNITTLTKLLGPRESKTLSFSPVSQVYYFAYPASYGDLTSILDNNGFDIITDFTKSVLSLPLTYPNFDGGMSDYNVYEFNNLTSQPTFNTTFNF